MEPAGWSGTIAEFLVVSRGQWRSALTRHHDELMRMPVDAGQTRAWDQSFYVLQDQLAHLVAHNAAARDWTLIFEYELPRERGRRPDVIILAGATILILEFKDARTWRQSFVDQVAAYARDIAHYHASSHHQHVIPMLVLTQAGDLTGTVDEVTISGPDGLEEVMLELVSAAPSGQPIDADAWLQADYAPLPSLVAAARTIFHHEPLPAIRRALSAGIPEAIDSLLSIARQAKATGSHHLALVTGVPGAGKTLVGLQFVYATHFETDQDDDRHAVFLSGNGPLVKVLQHALKTSVFVQDVHGYLLRYGGSRIWLPTEHIWVYDEAQRAWDADRVQQKRGHGASEPEDFLRLGERMGSWAMMVGLIGEGQEIHLGEEAGLRQWNDAIAALPGSWTVHCPSHVASLFGAAAAVVQDDRLNLTTSLRSHVAEDVQTWLSQLLNGDLDQAATTADRMRAQGFDAYVTRDLEHAKNYVTDRYAGHLDKRYGLLASSKAKNLVRWGVRNDFSFTKNLREGPWYNDDPESPRSCCQLKDVATEFACQGLELDFPIVCWGDDLRWNGQRWLSTPQPRSQARDPHQLRVNSYRVLLSRGRDGLVVFVPLHGSGDATTEALQASGLQFLD